MRGPVHLDLVVGEEILAYLVEALANVIREVLVKLALDLVPRLM